jgi:hypothetical protein
VEQGREVALTWGLTGEQIALLSSATRGRNAVSARTLFEELHGAVTAEAVEFFLAATAHHGL